MTKLILSLFICNILLVYFYSISSTFTRIVKFEINKIDKIIIGYSIFIIFLYFLYFFLKFDLSIIKLSLLTSLIIVFFNFKNFFFKLLISKEIIIINIVLIIILLPAIIYGQQFYIFRGNYWDSSNYLSSAVLMQNYDYKTILDQSYPEIFHKFQNMDRIITGRPLVNYLMSLLLNIHFSIFYNYYLFKCFISVLIYLSIFSTISKFKFLKNSNYNILIPAIFIFSFWNFYIFEIDALSHYAAIPILVLLTKFIFEKINNDLSKKYTCLTLMSSSLFLIYPEIIFLPIIFFFVEFLFDAKNKKKKEFTILFISIIFFLLITIPSIKTNYEYLFIKQVSQAIRPNDWWTYYGSFVLGKDNLITNYDFVELLKIKINSISTFEFLKIIHNGHFDNNYYFIYLNIIPSILGLYHVLPGKIDSLLFFLFNLAFLIILLFYLVTIIFNNIRYLLRDKKKLYKFLSIFIIFLIIGFYFTFKGNMWSTIKLYTFLFPFIFIFMSINFASKSANHIYIFLTFTFFLYKFIVFNNGIGRLDSFPSILNPKLKSNIEWQLPKAISKFNCKVIYLKNEDYIIQAYLNLMLINDQKLYKKNNNICNVKIKNENFKLYE